MKDRISVWVSGDQLDPDHPGLQRTDPGSTHVLMIESEALLHGRRFHRQRFALGADCDASLRCGAAREGLRR
ncbi:MAG TPA: cryptochrome/photolyase family protein [Polyangiales bacterium]